MHTGGGTFETMLDFFFCKTQKNANKRQILVHTRAKSPFTPTPTPTPGLINYAHVRYGPSNLIQTI